MDYIAEALTEAFGERCPDYAEGCHTCEAWKEYDRYKALSASPAGVGVEKAVRKHLEWFERFICDENELNSSTPRKVARNAQDAAAELRAALTKEVTHD